MSTRSRCKEGAVAEADGRDAGAAKDRSDWERILGGRVGEERPPAGAVRLSDLRPPERRSSTSDDVGGTETAQDLRARLRESEEARREALERVAELEAELSRLRAQLEEAHEIIRAIEQAYIAGERKGARPPQ